MGSKKLLKLNAFQLKEGINILDLKTLIKNSDIDHKIQFKLEEQLPLILNRYRRKYFETKDKKFRITIPKEIREHLNLTPDSELIFFSVAEWKERVCFRKG